MRQNPAANICSPNQQATAAQRNKHVMVCYATNPQITTSHARNRRLIPQVLFDVPTANIIGEKSDTIKAYRRQQPGGYGSAAAACQHIITPATWMRFVRGIEHYTTCRWIV